MGWIDVLDKVINWLIPTLCAAALGGMIGYAKRVKREREADGVVQRAVCALLRNHLYELHDKYMEKGFYPIHARENVQSLFKAYTSLGGNGTVPALMHELEQLPTIKDGGQIG